MVADMEANMVADMEVDMVSDMEVDTILTGFPNSDQFSQF